MNAPLWISAATGLAVQLVRDLLSDLRSRASEAAIDEAARRIAAAVMAAPLSKLSPEVHAATHTLMAVTLTDGLVSVAGLSKRTAGKLRTRVERKLMRAVGRQLEDAADDLLENAAKWERMLK